MKDIDNLPSELYSYIKEEIASGDIDLIRQRILDYFTNLNKKESTSQTLKGIYSNGLIRSIKYASSKVLKKIKK